VEKVAEMHIGILSRHSLWRESTLVVILLALAAIPRLGLAALGWPHTGSDEATVGLMTDDILRHHIFPIYFSGEHYLGAFQAYLAAPFFVLLGPTNLALHIVTTIQTLLFLIAFYASTRLVFSPSVALVSLLLLALGPPQVVFYELRAGAHAQDVLLFGSLLLLLIVFRLHHPHSERARIALALAIGITIGMGIWGTFLLLPFIGVTVIVLGIETIRRSRGISPWLRLRQIKWQLAAFILGVGGALVPDAIGTITSNGIAFRELFQTATASGSNAHSGLLQQLWGTLIVALPTILGRSAVCPISTCGTWPSVGNHGTFAIGLRDTLIALPFDAIAIGFWIIAAIPLARDVWSIISGWRSAGNYTSSIPIIDARWWGRCMLVIGGALTFLPYIASKSAYTAPQFTCRYLVGLYLCAPLAVEPLWQWSHPLWKRLIARPSHFSSPIYSPLRALLSSILLMAILAINIIGLAGDYQQTSDRQTLGVPSGNRDRQLIAYLEQSGNTYFYTTYWVCHQVMFEASERVTCGVVDNFNAFLPGLNRVPAYAAQVAATQNPAYVFDTTTNEAASSMLQQMATYLANGDPRLRGYHTTLVAGYLIYYR
jgi:Dolichyl-phosphate-mannose-protein mannosyltransferase